MKLFIVLLLFCLAASAQSKSTDNLSSMPSKEEISELLNKADEKTTAFEQAVRNAKSYLDRIDPKLAANYLDGASTAHLLIESTQKNGSSAYRLIGILATLDDLSRSASNGAVELLRTDEEHVARGNKPDVGALSAVLLLNTAGTGCYDISELLMHATMRFVNVEEQTLAKLLDSTK